MAMLADLVELVIGVDTHKHTHTAAVVMAATGAMVDQATVPATPAGYRQLLELMSARLAASDGKGGPGQGYADAGAYVADLEAIELVADLIRVVGAATGGRVADYPCFRLLHGAPSVAFRTVLVYPESP